MTQDRPASVTAAVWLTAAVIALSGVSAVLAIVFSDELTDAWRGQRADVGSVEPPSIGPVAVVMLVVVAVLIVVLLEFFRARHGWARNVLSVMVLLVALAALATLRLDPPPLFAVAAALMVLLDVGVVVALWLRPTTAYLRVRPPA